MEERWRPGCVLTKDDKSQRKGITIMFVKSMAAAGAMLALSTLTAGAVTAIAETDLNVRAGPGTDYQIVGLLPQGTPVEVLNCSGSWCRVAGNVQGYASRSYLSIGGQGPSAAAPVYAPEVYTDYGYYDYGPAYVYGPSVGVVVGPGFRHQRHHRFGHSSNWQRHWSGQGAGRWQGQPGFNRPAGGFAGSKQFGGGQPSAGVPAAMPGRAGGQPSGGRGDPRMKGG
jgi:uncharacterized protein YraI